MIITKEKIKQITQEKGIKDMTVVEKDYALLWALKCIYSNQKLFQPLIFKGGTCISKVYIPNYRFSEDLDFTISKDYPIQKETLKKEIEESLQNSEKQDGPILELIQDNGYSNPGMIAYKVRYLGPLNHPAFIKLEISIQESMSFPPETKNIQKTPYSDMPKFKLNSYSFNEILVEKIRAIMQRGKSRDYFDVWQLLKQKEFKNKVSMDFLRSKVKEKCDLKGIGFEPELMFDDAKLNKATQYWEESLGRLMPTVPKFETVITELVKEEFFPESNLFNFSLSFNAQLLDDIDRTDNTELLIKRAYHLADQKYLTLLNSKKTQDVIFGIAKLEELYQKKFAQKPSEEVLIKIINLQDDRNHEINQNANGFYSRLKKRFNLLKRKVQ